MVTYKHKRLLVRILKGTATANINFSQIRELLNLLGFHERVKGSHHIYTRDDVVEILNIQPDKGKGKPYQIKQIRNIIIKYQLGDWKDEQV